MKAPDPHPIGSRVRLTAQFAARLARSPKRERPPERLGTVVAHFQDRGFVRDTVKWDSTGHTENLRPKNLEVVK